MVDVGTIVGRSGTPVERHLCAPAATPTRPAPTSPRTRSTGRSRSSRAASAPSLRSRPRAKEAGAIGIVLVDNRPGEANGIPIKLEIPQGMIADLDGAILRAAMAPSGRIHVRIGRAFEDIVTGRSGIVTSFSSAGPESINHILKPDIAARAARSSRRRCPSSAAARRSRSSTGRAWRRRTSRAPLRCSCSVTLVVVGAADQVGPDVHRRRRVERHRAHEGGARHPAGCRPRERARGDTPQIFTEPSSLSFGMLNGNHGAVSRGLLLRLQDAGGGSGTWTVTLQPQSATTGTGVIVPSIATVGPGGETDISVVASASAAAPRARRWASSCSRRAPSPAAFPTTSSSRSRRSRACPRPS